MKVLLRNPRRELDLDGPRRVHALLDQLGLRQPAGALVRLEVVGRGDPRETRRLDPDQTVATAGLRDGELTQAGKHGERDLRPDEPGQRAGTVGRPGLSFHDATEGRQPILESAACPRHGEGVDEGALDRGIGRSRSENAHE